MSIITILLSSGEELVAEFIKHDDRQLLVRQPLRIEYAERDNEVYTRLARFMSQEDGKETILYMQHVVATSECSQKAVDYYTNAVDKYYSDGLLSSPSREQASRGDITTEEILSLISGRIKLQ
jgi:hypothetical protein